MDVKLLVHLYKEKDFKGESRYIIDSENELKSLGFNDDTSSVRVIRGPNYKPGDVVRFYQHPNFGGRFAEMGPGEYPDVHNSPINLGDKISSIELTSIFVPVADPIGLIVKLFNKKDYEGKCRTIIYTSPSLAIHGFDEDVSSLQVFKGPDYNGEVVTFYQNDGYTGITLEPKDIEAGTNIPNLKEEPYKFNNKISSLRIHAVGDDI